MTKRKEIQLLQDENTKLKAAYELLEKREKYYFLEYMKSKDQIKNAASIIASAGETNSGATDMINKLREENEQLNKKLAKQVYGTTKVVYSKEAEKSLKEIKKLGFDNLPICVAKTQYSLSDNQKLLGAPKDFELTVRNIEIRSGAGFLVVLLGNMLLMPGLSKNPAAVNMTIDESGKIEGLF